MALPHVFANQTNPTMPELDDNFNAVASLVTVQCTAVGTNTIALTPTANAPVVTSYGAGQPFRFGFTAVATSTGPVSVAVSGLGALPVYLPNGSQAIANSLTSGTYYEIAFVGSYNSNAGGWAITSVLPASTAVPFGIGGSQALVITNNASSPTFKIDVTAHGALFITSTGTPVYVAAPSFTIDLSVGTAGTATANGMDGTARPTNGWVYLYMISNGSVAAGLGTVTSPTIGNPSLPIGYTYSFYIGAMFCNASANLFGSRQLGAMAQYVISGGGLTGYPTLASGTFASTTLSTLTLIGVARQVTGASFTAPLTAGRIQVVVADQGSAQAYALAPNNSYGGTNATNPAPIASQGVASGPVVNAEVLLESNSVYWAATGTSPVALVAGWTDYWSR